MKTPTAIIAAVKIPFVRPMTKIVDWFVPDLNVPNPVEAPNERYCGRGKEAL
jgi:hypothetical protein